VTIICALRDGDDLYLAADSAISGLPTKALAESKIDYSDLMPLAWGTAGDEAVGDLWGAWLKTQLAAQKDLLAVTWETVITMGSRRLSEQNAVIYQNRTNIRVGVDPERDYTQVLLAGFINGTPEIAHLRVSGDFDMHLEAGRSFACMGAGRDMAAAAHELLSERGLLPASGEQCIRDVCEFVARVHPSCVMPVKVIHVTQQGVVA
jgi:hypothetical protein